jgi:hypothetical protein
VNAGRWRGDPFREVFLTVTRRRGTRRTPIRPSLAAVLCVVALGDRPGILADRLEGARWEGDVPDFLKKVTKDKSGALGPGEEYVGAMFAQAAGTVTKTVAYGLGGVVGGLAAESVQMRRQGEAGAAGTASGFPPGNVVMAVTGQRFLVFGHSALKGSPTDLLAEYPLSDVHEITLEKRRAHLSMGVRFSDNSVRDFDVVKMAKPERFIEAFDHAKGRR